MPSPAADGDSQRLPPSPLEGLLGPQLSCGLLSSPSLTLVRFSWAFFCFVSVPVLVVFL
ncbi:uncharacterized protein DS421_18g603510 [Arachis hypogaea]|nr:uncharacterized protein DS421_18g603510 [Arachis hypogaea]